MKYKEFLKITNEVFCDLDEVIIWFSNELTKDDRELIYKNLIHVNDETINSYHTLVKLVYEKSEEGNEEFESDATQVFEVKRIISTYQESLSNTLSFLNEILKKSETHREYSESGIDLEELCKKVSCYLD